MTRKITRVFAPEKHQNKVKEMKDKWSMKANCLNEKQIPKIPGSQIMLKLPPHLLLIASPPKLHLISLKMEMYTHNKSKSSSGNSFAIKATITPIFSDKKHIKKRTPVNKCTFLMD